MLEQVEIFKDMIANASLPEVLEDFEQACKENEDAARSRPNDFDAVADWQWIRTRLHGILTALETSGRWGY